MIKTVYKVVEPDGNGRLLSAVAQEDTFVVEYVKGRWVRPKIRSFLFAFDRESAAIGFAAMSDEIWEAEADVVHRLPTDPKLLKQPRAAWHSSYISFWRRVLAKTRSVTDFSYKCGAPVGTVYCRKIRLVKRVR